MMFEEENTGDPPHALPSDSEEVRNSLLHKLTFAFCRMILMGENMLT